MKRLKPDVSNHWTESASTLFSLVSAAAVDLNGRTEPGLPRAANLTGRSETLAGLVREGKLKIVYAMHDVATGKVSWFG